MAKYPALMLWTDAYLADTRHLNTAQHGAYLLILMTMWRSRDCSIPDDDQYLAAITGMDVRTWRKNKPTIATFLQRAEGGTITQKRLLEERKFADQVNARRSLAGREGAKARWLETDGTCHADAIEVPMRSHRQKMAIPHPQPQLGEIPGERVNGRNSLASLQKCILSPSLQASEEFKQAIEEWIDHMANVKQLDFGQPALKSLISRCERWGPEKSIRAIRESMEASARMVREPFEQLKPNGSGRNGKHLSSEEMLKLQPPHVQQIIKDAKSGKLPF